MRRRISTFLVILTLLTIFGYSFLAFSLSDGFDNRRLFYLVLAIPFIFFWLMPAVYWERDESKERFWEKYFVWTAMFSMGLLSFLITTAFIRDVVMFTARFFSGSLNERLQSPEGVKLVIIPSLCGMAAGIFFAFRGPKVKEVKVFFDDLPLDLEGFRIAQISDLHIGVSIRAGYVEDVVQKVNSAKADTICLTGDIFDGYLSQLKDQVAPLKKMTAKYGKFFITGNHEYYWGSTDWAKESEKLGLIPLLNEAIEIKQKISKIAFVGVVDFAAGHFTKDLGPEPEKILKNVDPSAFKILLAHQPKIAERASEAGYDLQLSGHTHAGQFLPWTFVAKLFHRHFAGLSHEGKMQIYVNSGTAFWGPPVRLGSTTEITLLTLHNRTAI